ncbi:MAG TPA: hypothetical protein VGE27_19220 [Gemmatimonas sp.]|uniref:hypothetical protein n=1 Tax=Gemmatimonas sp. TaxID=1962908 RepID=UPI002ED9FECC
MWIAGLAAVGLAIGPLWRPVLAQEQGESLVVRPVALGTHQTQRASLPVQGDNPRVVRHEQAMLSSAERALAVSALQPPPRTAPWWAPVASVALPGAGQFVLRQQRSAAYAVAEGYLILQYLAARRDGNRERETYRQIAVDVARRQFGGDFPVGAWEYYERMEKFQESGAYNRNPGGPLTPETDETTFNGNRWKFARETYWRDPNVEPSRNSSEYQNAIAFYERTAVRDDFRWSWRDARLEQDQYKETINGANRSYQRAVNYAGVLLVNHLTALIDAYVSVRLRRYGSAGSGGLQVQKVEARYEPIGDPLLGQGQWRASLQVGRGPR